MKKNRKWYIVLSVIGLVLLLLIGTMFLYINDYYHAEPAALEAFQNLPDGISARTEDLAGVGQAVIFEPDEIQAGFIFYPGGKVQYEAYAPLLRELSEQGILCVMLRMPGNLAVLDINAADGVQELFPQVKTWYMGGHSLGGSMAAVYLVKHTEEYAGLVLLAAYSTADLSEANLNIVSIYGSEDGVMNRDKYEKYQGNLGRFQEYIIDGGCHAGVGLYGAQSGDGVPAISSEEQIKDTVNIIAGEILSGN